VARTKATAPKTTRARRKAAVEPGSRGLLAREVAAGAPPREVEDLARAVEADGGRVLARYRDPVGGHWHLLCSLPVECVKPTPFQRDLSEAHVKRLADAISRIDRYLDPIIAVRGEPGTYWTPNGHHRTAALRLIGGKSIMALVLPDRDVAYRILAMNTEKAHGLREKALEVIRMARSLAELDPRPESSYAVEFEEPALLTLGIAYEQRPRFAGGAYNPVLRRVEAFLEERLPAALRVRAGRAGRLMELDDAVGAAVQQLKARGFESPYLRAFVVARCNPLRFRPEAGGTFDDVIGKMTEAAKAFDAGKIKAEHVARAAGPPEE
jgi:ParB family chromosome partitioning protein